MSTKRAQIPTWMKNKGYVKQLRGVLGNISGRLGVIIVDKNGNIRIGNNAS